METIGERIKKIRKKEDETQKNFAKSLNLTQAQISSIESNTRNATERTIEDICRVYDVNKEWLINGTGEMKIKKTKKDELKEQIHNIIDKFDDEEIAILQKIAEKIKGM